MKEYGYIYSGNYTNQRKYGITKIGMTQKAPSARRANIERESGHKFRMRKYVRIANISKVDLMFLEAWVRRDMASLEILTYDEERNDHFDFLITAGQKEEQFEMLADKMIESAMSCLKFMGYKETDIHIKACR